jgi:hypothetical protein
VRTVGGKGVLPRLIRPTRAETIGLVPPLPRAPRPQHTGIDDLIRRTVLVKAEQANVTVAGMLELYREEECYPDVCTLIEQIAGRFGLDLDALLMRYSKDAVAAACPFTTKTRTNDLARTWKDGMRALLRSIDPAPTCCLRLSAGTCAKQRPPKSTRPRHPSTSQRRSRDRSLALMAP